MRYRGLELHVAAVGEANNQIRKARMNAPRTQAEGSEKWNESAQGADEPAACGPGCACNSGPSGRARWIVGAVVIVIAGVLAARAMLKSDSGAAQKADAAFSLSQSAGTATAAAEGATVPSNAPAKVGGEDASPDAAAGEPGNRAVVCGESIRSLSDLNQKAMDKGGVFVFLAGRDAAKNREIAAVIEKGAATLRGRNISMGVFTLEAGSSEYANIVRQVPPPGVLAMVKGRGALAVTDDITEPKLIQAFVAAANAGGGCSPSGCGPSSSGCN